MHPLCALWGFLEKFPTSVFKERQTETVRAQWYGIVQFPPNNCGRFETIRCRRHSYVGIPREGVWNFQGIILDTPDDEFSKSIINQKGFSTIGMYVVPIAFKILCLEDVITPKWDDRFCPPRNFSEWLQEFDEADTKVHVQHHSEVLHEWVFFWWFHFTLVAVAVEFFIYHGLVIVLSSSCLHIICVDCVTIYGATRCRVPPSKTIDQVFLGQSSVHIMQHCTRGQWEASVTQTNFLQSEVAMRHAKRGRFGTVCRGMFADGCIVWVLRTRIRRYARFIGNMWPIVSCF